MGLRLMKFLCELIGTLGGSWKESGKAHRFFGFKRKAAGCGGQDTDPVPGQL